MSNINPKPGLCSFDLSTLVISDEKVIKTWQQVWIDGRKWQKTKSTKPVFIKLALNYSDPMLLC